MFDFDEIDLNEYSFTYDVKPHLISAYNHYLRESNLQDTPDTYHRFLFDYVKNQILTAYRKYHEDEQEWSVLKHYAQELAEQYESGAEETELLVKKAHILYDRYLNLTHEGFEIPNLK